MNVIICNHKNFLIGVRIHQSTCLLKKIYESLHYNEHYKRFIKLANIRKIFVDRAILANLHGEYTTKILFQLIVQDEKNINRVGNKTSFINYYKYN
jgi:hypothetical protein